MKSSHLVVAFLGRNTVQISNAANTKLPSSIHLRVPVPLVGILVALFYFWGSSAPSPS